MEYAEFMKAMSKAPWSGDCSDCGGVGLKPIGCCSGYMCGCYGMVVDYEKCDCGAPEPTDEQIEEWSKL